MVEISVKCCGDHWINRREVEDILEKIPADTQVMLNMCAEGASMTALGIDRVIDRYLRPGQVCVRAWSNNVDTVHYQRTERHLYSHFFWMAERYWDAQLLADTHEFRFAAFVGRPTWPRIRVLHDLRQSIGNNCLFSLMNTHDVPKEDAYNLDRKNTWFADDFDHMSVLGDLTSLDGHRVADQYDPRYNTNLSIVSHYHRFDIEIVCETYCFGPAFLPTEKTIRPMLYRKPIMVYGPRNFLRNLRDQGFRTWGDCWDEFYDVLEGPDRWQAMLEQIKILAACDHFDQIYHDYQEIVEHNRARAREIGVKFRPL